MPSLDFVHDLSDNLSKKRTPHIIFAVYRGKIAVNVNSFSNLINAENQQVILAALEEIQKVIEIDDIDPNDVPGKNFELCEVIRNQGIEYLILTVKKRKDEYSVRWYLYLKDKVKLKLLTKLLILTAHSLSIKTLLNLNYLLILNILIKKQKKNMKN